jgi:TetR/AcrR family transcriptional repressor of lmrAB and yxaGH operons
MGQKGDETRTRMLDATRDLVESRGYFGTGLNQVLADSGAPRGSLYFHFPGGKDQLVAEALTRSGQDVASIIDGLAASNAADFVDELLTRMGDRLEESGWHKGCPVATVALETAATNDTIQQVCSAAYTSWERTLRDRLVRAGRPDADELATAILALIEGALLLARTHRSRRPLTAVNRTIKALL